MTLHEEQVTRIFEESREDVYRYLLTLGLPPPQAQEATQEAFLRLYVAMEQLGKAWQTLSPQQRQCLHLRAEGLRYREIAETMRISIPSAREFLGRAITRLQKAVYE